MTCQKSLVGIFGYFIDVNIIHLLFDWPADTEDSKISEKMFSIFINKVREIQLKLSEVMKGVITIKITTMNLLISSFLAEVEE